MQVLEAILSIFQERVNIQMPADLSLALADPRGLFAILIVVAIALYGLSVGKTKALVSLLSIYVAYTLTVLFPFLPWLQDQIILPERAPILTAGLFIAFYIATFFILLSSTLKHRLTLGEISIIKIVCISIVQLGLMASITISLLPSDFNEKTFGVVLPYLAGQRILWLWAASSLAIVPFTKSHHYRE